MKKNNIRNITIGMAIYMLTGAFCGITAYATEQAPVEQAQEQVQEEAADEGGQEAAEQDAAEQENIEEAAEQVQPVQPNNVTTDRTTNVNNEAETEEAVEDTVLQTEGGSYTLKLLKNANLRVEASTGSDSKIVVPLGITLSSDEKVTNSEGEVWYKASYGNGSGYLREDTVEVTVNEIEDEANAEEVPDGEEVVSEEAETQENTDAAESVNETNDTSNTVAVEQTTETTETSSSNSFDSEEQTEVTVKSRRKIDIISIMFFGIAVIGVIFSYITASNLRYEYRKNMRYMQAEEKKKEREQY